MYSDDLKLKFDETAYNIYSQGIHDYKAACEKIILNNLNEFSNAQKILQAILQAAQDMFEYVNKDNNSKTRMTIGELKQLINDIPDDYVLWFEDNHDYVYSPRSFNINNYYKQVTFEE